MGQQNDVDPCDLLLGHEHVPDFEVKFIVKITLTVLYSLILLAGVLGNSITIQTCKILQKKGYMQKSVTDHMISLACSDLLVILLGMPVELYSVIWYPFSTTFGNITCKAYCFLFEACSYTTVFHVATLSFERYIAICHPFKFKSISWTCTVKLMICFAWFTSVCVALPFIFAMGTEYPLEPVANYKGVHNCSRPSTYHLYSGGPQSNVTLCTAISSKWVVFQSSIFSAFVIYILILGSVAFMCRNMMNVLMASNGRVTVKGSKGNNMECMTKTQSSEAKSARKQTIVFLGLIVASLTVCWMPNQILRIMAASKPKQDWTVTYFRAYLTLLPIADTFFYLSSVVNPLLYTISSKQFRKVFLQILRCRLTIEHANKAKLPMPDSSSSGGTSYKRPLLFMSSRRYPSVRPTNQNVLSTFQSIPEPDCSPEECLQELPDSSSEVHLQVPCLERKPSARNGLSETEI